METPPIFGSIRFSCPHCGAFAHQHWAEIRCRELEKDATPRRLLTEKVLEIIEDERQDPKIDEKIGEKFLSHALRASKGAVFVADDGDSRYTEELSNLDASRCDSCGEISIWLQDKLVYPATGPSGMANLDMPDKVKSLFDEAGAVFQASPRAAAALLRLALQHLLNELTGKDQKIDTSINELIDKGLDAELSKLMHSLRIIGNEAVHPGTIDVHDEPAMAEVMFDILNQIVEQMISRPSKNEALWEKLPENKRQPVEQKLAKRDKSK